MPVEGTKQAGFLRDMGAFGTVIRRAIVGLCRA